MRILVPTDGSAPAQRALAHAIALLRDPAADEIVLVNVQSPNTLDVSDISGVMTAVEDRQFATQQSEKALKKGARLCRKARIRFRERAALGPVAETVARLAEEFAADQIVIGSRGLGTLGRLVLGSVANGVVRYARVPVTIVK
jgi:nucleotide-binding universal stress UspA family protein